MSLPGLIRRKNHKNVEQLEEGWFYCYINECSMSWCFDVSHSNNDPDDKGTEILTEIHGFRSLR